MALRTIRRLTCGKDNCAHFYECFATVTNEKDVFVPHTYTAMDATGDGHCEGNVVVKCKDYEEKEKTTTDELFLEGGKYRFYIKKHSLYCDRYGEEWREFVGDSAVLALFQECLARIDNLPKDVEPSNKVKHMAFLGKLSKK